MSKIQVKGTEITLFTKKDSDYICITDLARYKNPLEPKDVIKNWLRNRSTIEYLGLWEKINNPNFKGVEFDLFRNQSGSNYFVLSPSKWIQYTSAIGVITKRGSKGGTFAHKDIAFEFASWISVEFKLYLIKEFQRLKEEESQRKSLDWDIKRNLAKINYKIHTDAIKEKLIPKKVTKKQEERIYASEADLLNVALFGMTAKEWRDKNKRKEGNIRDYATIHQLICLSNLENLNALFIKDNLPSSERLVKLNEIAISQMKSLLQNKSVKNLEHIGNSKIKDS